MHHRSQGCLLPPLLRHLKSLYDSLNFFHIEVGSIYNSCYRNGAKIRPTVFGGLYGSLNGNAIVVAPCLFRLLACKKTLIAKPIEITEEETRQCWQAGPTAFCSCLVQCHF